VGKKYLIQVIVNGIMILLSISSCMKPVKDNLITEIDSISKKWVPDKREGICNVTVKTGTKIMVIKGETNFPEAKHEIIDLLIKHKADFIDSLVVLPDNSVAYKPYGLVTVSVCNIRESPFHDAEMISQAIMGTPVKIYREKRGWYLIQTPDMYIGWTEGESIESITNEKYSEWKSSERVVFMNKAGDIFTDSMEGGIVSDIVAGCIMVSSGTERGYQKVILPDGRTGFIHVKSSLDFKTWIKGLHPAPENIIKTAFWFMGTPYLWGGTSSKGMDCSGFVKTVYFLNGMVLARDVSLQYRHVKHMPPEFFPDSLKKGDLLFFGSIRDGKIRPTHVGLYIGNSEFIHCSGMVRINSLDSTKTNFSRYRKNTYLGSGRIIGQQPESGTRLMEGHNWYN
jgi:hypothetical protein